MKQKKVPQQNSLYVKKYKMITVKTYHGLSCLEMVERLGLFVYLIVPTPTQGQDEPWKVFLAQHPGKPGKVIQS
jgi:hypothetical protein